MTLITLLFGHMLPPHILNAFIILLFILKIFILRPPLQEYKDILPRIYHKTNKNR